MCDLIFSWFVILVKCIILVFLDGLTRNPK